MNIRKLRKRGAPFCSQDDARLVPASASVIIAHPGWRDFESSWLFPGVVDDQRGRRSEIDTGDDSPDGARKSGTAEFSGQGAGGGRPLVAARSALEQLGDGRLRPARGRRARRDARIPQELAGDRGNSGRRDGDAHARPGRGHQDHDGRAHSRWSGRRRARRGDRENLRG